MTTTATATKSKKTAATAAPAPKPAPVVEPEVINDGLEGFDDLEGDVSGYAEYAADLDGPSGPKFAWLQADRYQPELDSVVKVGFVEESLELLSESTQAALNCAEPRKIYVGNDGDTAMFYEPQADLRLVVLKIPRLFVVDDKGNYGHLTKGLKLSESKLKTVARLHMAMIIDGELAMTDDGELEIVTLNLRSSKTELIGNVSDKPGAGTLRALNNALLARMKQRRKSLIHMASIVIGAEPKLFKSKVNGESSKGIMFKMLSGGRLLSLEQLAIVRESMDSLEDDFKDPFHISGKTAPVSNEPTEEIVEEFIATFTDAEIDEDF